MKFTPEEDKKLLELVAAQGARNWPKIAQSLPHRNARQCRERYKNYLAPGVSSRPFSDDEEILLRKLINEYGQKWSLIAQHFQNRTDVSLKNHWINVQRKDRRMEKQSKNSETSSNVICPNLNQNLQNNTTPVTLATQSIPRVQSPALPPPSCVLKADEWYAPFGSLFFDQDWMISNESEF